MCLSGGSDCVGELGVDLVALIDQFGDGAERLGVGGSEIPGCTRSAHRSSAGGSFGAGLGHGDHQPFRNFGRAGMAWITAVPSSSLTTPISKRFASRGRADEHRDVRVVGLERSPVVSQCVEHVVGR